MFTIEIAGIPIAIDNHFGAVKCRCEGYMTQRQALFTVSVGQEEMIRESGRPCAAAEELCVYRQIALGMMEYDAFLMHAAVIDVDGQGVAFAAKSGTGKTTRLLLWKRTMGDRVKPVNGDKPILRFVDGTLYAYGTPWMGKENLGANIRTPMRYVCFIERAPEVFLRRLEPDELIPRLFRQVLVPKDPVRLERFIPLMERFAASVSFCLLGCVRDREEPEKIWTQMKEM